MTTQFFTEQQRRRESSMNYAIASYEVIYKSSDRYDAWIIYLKR